MISQVILRSLIGFLNVTHLKTCAHELSCFTEFLSCPSTMIGMLTLCIQLSSTCAHSVHFQCLLAPFPVLNVN